MSRHPESEMADKIAKGAFGCFFGALFAAIGALFTALFRGTTAASATRGRPDTNKADLALRQGLKIYSGHEVLSVACPHCEGRNESIADVCFWCEENFEYSYDTQAAAGQVGEQSPKKSRFADMWLLFSILLFVWSILSFIVVRFGISFITLTLSAWLFLIYAYTSGLHKSNRFAVFWLLLLVVLIAVLGSLFLVYMFAQ